MKRILWLAMIMTSELKASAIKTCGSAGILRFPITVESPEVHYFIDANDADFEANIDNAYAQWSAVEEAVIDLVKVTAKEEAEIVVSLSTGNYANSAGDLKLVLKDGTCDLSHVSLDISKNSAINMYDLLHETGHTLGLGHSIVAAAIMSYHGYGATSLTLDDEFALASLYPVSGENLPPGCATISSHAPNGHMLWLFLLPLFSTLTPRRGNRSHR